MQVSCILNLYAALLVAILTKEHGLQTWNPVGTGTSQRANRGSNIDAFVSTSNCAKQQSSDWPYHCCVEGSKISNGSGCWQHQSQHQQSSVASSHAPSQRHQQANCGCQLCSEGTGYCGRFQSGFQCCQHFNSISPAGQNVARLARAFIN